MHHGNSLKLANSWFSSENVLRRLRSRKLLIPTKARKMYSFTENFSSTGTTNLGTSVSFQCIQKVMWLVEESNTYFCFVLIETNSKQKKILSYYSFGHTLLHNRFVVSVPMVGIPRHHNSRLKMAPVKVPDSRWIRRYRKYLICGLGIMCIQVLLAYAFFSLESVNVGTISEPRDMSGKRRLNVEVSAATPVLIHKTFEVFIFFVFHSEVRYAF